VRKSFKLTCLTLLLLTLFTFPADAGFKLSPQLGFGVTSFRGALSGNENYRANEWLTRLTFTYEHKDLLFTGEYHSGNGLGEGRPGRVVAEIGANYLILQDDILRVYGGIGYQHLKVAPPHANLSLTGGDFVGQALVAIEILDELDATLTVKGSPWLKWPEAGGKKGGSFAYDLSLAYDFKEEYGLRLGLLGGRYQIPLEGKSTSAAFTGVNLGLIWRF